MSRKGWGGPRAGAGRPKADRPPRHLRINASDEEMELLAFLTTRERTDALLKAARKKKRIMDRADELTNYGTSDPSAARPPTAPRRGQAAQKETEMNHCMTCGQETYFDDEEIYMDEHGDQRIRRTRSATDHVAEIGANGGVCPLRHPCRYCEEGVRHSPDVCAIGEGRDWEAKEEFDITDFPLFFRRFNSDEMSSGWYLVYGSYEEGGPSDVMVAYYHGLGGEVPHPVDGTWHDEIGRPIPPPAYWLNAEPMKAALRQYERAADKQPPARGGRATTRV